MSAKRVVYLGDLEGIVKTLRSLPDIELTGWIYERGDAVAVPTGKHLPMIPVLNVAQLQDALEELAPLDLGIVSNFGIILSRANLETPRLGFVNVHLGLLPENPGREPVRSAIAREAEVTGVTLHRMTEEVDEGPIVDRVAVSAVCAGEADLFERLAALAGDVLANKLPAILAG